MDGSDRFQVPYIIDQKLEVLFYFYIYRTQFYIYNTNDF